MPCMLIKVTVPGREGGIVVNLKSVQALPAAPSSGPTMLFSAPLGVERTAGLGTRRRWVAKPEKLPEGEWSPPSCYSYCYTPGSTTQINGNILSTSIIFSPFFGQDAVKSRQFLESGKPRLKLRSCHLLAG